ncbi:MAG: IS21-like element ISMac3 family transposase [Candidatus Acidiferrum sp.]
MLNLEEWMDIKSLYREGHTIKAIARLTGRSRNTVRRVLREAVPSSYPTLERNSCLDPFKIYAQERFEGCGLSAIRLLEEIRGMGYTGSVWTLRRYLGSFKPERERLHKLTVRFETPAGQQAQADWAYCGRFPDTSGRIVPVYAFVMVLGFSRMLYVEFTSSMKLSALIRCHVNAFAFFGGWTREILYDNMKQVRLSPNELNPQFIDFARHYDFLIKTHRVRRPRTKGKVERMVLYVKDAFLKGRSFADFSDLNAQARHWLAHTANVRIHATTHQRPLDLWPQEGLTALSSIAPYHIHELFPRQAGFDAFVRFDKSRYSLPPEYAGQTVAIGKIAQRILIRCGDMIVAEHRVAQKPGSTVADSAHLGELWRLSLRKNKTPLPRWQLRFHSEVQTIPLADFQAVSQ